MDMVSSSGCKAAEGQGGMWGNTWKVQEFSFKAMGVNFNLGRSQGLI